MSHLLALPLLGLFPSLLLLAAALLGHLHGGHGGGNLVNVVVDFVFLGLLFALLLLKLSSCETPLEWIQLNRLLDLIE